MHVLQSSIFCDIVAYIYIYIYVCVMQISTSNMPLIGTSIYIAIHSVILVFCWEFFYVADRTKEFIEGVCSAYII